MLIRDVMSRGVVTVHPDTSLKDAADLMKELDVGVLPVCDGEHLRGMVTDRDITVRAVASALDPVTGRVHEVMSEAAHWCYEDEDVSEAAHLMDEHQIRRLPIMDRTNKLVGIVSLGDIAITTGDERLAGRTLERVSEPAKPDVEVGSDGGVLQEPPDQVARRTVAGIFADRMEAERAIDDLRMAGVDAQRVGVITKDPSQAHEIATSTGAATVASAASGVGIGAILGGAAGWLIGVGALAIPGIGPVIAAGPIAAALGIAGTTAAVGAGAGALAGGLVGALTGWGFSETEAHEYERRVSEGDILLTADVNDELVPRAEEILRRDGGEHINTRRAA
jgi:CBS domain-containing protein